MTVKKQRILEGVQEVTDALISLYGPIVEIRRKYSTTSTELELAQAKLNAFKNTNLIVKASKILKNFKVDSFDKAAFKEFMAAIIRETPELNVVDNPYYDIPKTFAEIFESHMDAWWTRNDLSHNMLELIDKGEESIRKGDVNLSKLVPNMIVEWNKIKDQLEENERKTIEARFNKVKTDYQSLLKDLLRESETLSLNSLKPSSRMNRFM